MFVVKRSPLGLDTKKAIDLIALNKQYSGECRDKEIKPAES